MFCKNLFSLENSAVTIVTNITDTIDTWDENKLQEVVDKKHGSSEKSKPKTEIVSEESTVTMYKYCYYRSVSISYKL